MKSIKTILMISAAMLFFFGCHSRTAVDFADLGMKDAGKTVLVAGELSEFRYGVIQAVAANFPDVFFKVMTFDDAKDNDLSAFEAVIVVDQLEAWMMMNGKSKRLMKRADPGRIIPFITAGDPDWTWKDEDLGIEAVTGPSEQPRKKEMVDKISSRLKKIINP